MLRQITIGLLALTVTAFADAVHCPLSVYLAHSHGTPISASITTQIQWDTAYCIETQSWIRIRALAGFRSQAAAATINVPFHSIRKDDCAQGAPSRDAFTLVGPGQTLHREIDIARLFHLEPDLHHASAHSIFPYIVNEHPMPLTWGSSMKLAIDDISVPVSESQARTAPQTHPHRHRKRTTIKNDCSTAQRQAIAKANQACTKLANAAAEAALSGPVDDLQSYFKSASQSARQKVAGIYRTVTTECDKTPNGTSTPHCTDPYNNCHGDLLAYTYWQGSGRSQVGTTDYCPRYFNGAVLQAKGDQCHEQSRVTNTLHEITHALAGTSDVAYGIDGAMALSSEDVVVHADTYALFATDLDLGCIGGSSGSAPSGAASSHSALSSWSSPPAASSSSSS